MDENSCSNQKIQVLFEHDFFCNSIQFYVLLSPFLCVVSFLYLGLYVLGDDAWISYGSFMQIKHQCVHILT